MHVCCLVVLIKEKKAIDFHNNIGIHKFTESAYAFPEGISKNIGPVRFAEKPGWKVLFADLLWEKNIVP